MICQEGEFITKGAIAKIIGKGVKPLTQNFKSFEILMKDCCTYVGQTIKSSKSLVQMIVGKARLLSDIIGKALTHDEENQ